MPGQPPRRLRRAFAFVRRRAWLLPGVVFLLVAAGTLGAGSYFLHGDTPTQHVAAADLARGCWAYSAATLAPMVLLAGPFALTGPNPAWEMILLSLLGAAMAAAFARLLWRVTGSRRWALLGGLWFVGLPVVLYYTRIHIGYPLAFFTLGVMLHVERRPLWAGLALGLAVTSHINYGIPVALWLGWSFLLDKETRRFDTVWKMAVGGLAPLLALEGARFLYLGEPFGWIRAQAAEAMRLSAIGDGREHWPAMHIPALIAFANGPVNLALLIAGLAYPFVRRPHARLMDAVALAGWSLIALYMIRISLLGNTFLTPRMVSGAYPLLAATAVFTIMRGVGRLMEKLRPRAALLTRIGGAVIVGLALPAALLDHALDAAAGSQTAFPVAAEAVARAADEGLPVRYFGTFGVGIALGQRYGAVVSANDTAVDSMAGDHASVLIFEDANDRTAEAWLADPRVDPADYDVTVVPHRTAYRPAAVEAYNMSPARLRDVAARLFAHNPDADQSELAIYWPRDPHGEPILRSAPEEYAYLYGGSGCNTPRPFEGGWNYYNLLGAKLGEVGRALRAGDLRGAVELVRGWLE